MIMVGKQYKTLAHNYKYWIMNIIHNVFMHPFMPLADLCLLFHWAKIANFIYRLHQNTMPSRYV